MLLCLALLFEVTVEPELWVNPDYPFKHVHNNANNDRSQMATQTRFQSSDSRQFRSFRSSHATHPPTNMEVENRLFLERKKYMFRSRKNIAM